MNKSTELNKREEQAMRNAYNKIAGHYLCDPDEDDIEVTGIKDNYDQYLELVKQSELGNGDDIASDYVNVWEDLEHHTVDYIIDLIDSSMPVENDNVPKFMQNIDWDLLKKQKQALLQTITYLENNNLPKEYIDYHMGILHLIDALQDSAVDDYCYEEERVFQISND